MNRGNGDPAAVEHPVWCAPGECDVWDERDGGTVAFHTVTLLDECGIRVWLVQALHWSPTGAVISVETGVYFEQREDRVEAWQLSDVAAAFALAAELVGFDPAAQAASLAMQAARERAASGAQAGAAGGAR